MNNDNMAGQIRSTSSETIDPQNSQETPFTRADPDFWLEDGNVVILIAAGQTTFRVYKGLLAKCFCRHVRH